LRLIANLQRDRMSHVKKLLSIFILGLALGAGTANAQYSPTNCSNVVQSSMNAVNNQKQSVDAVNNWLGQLQSAANACLTSMAQTFASGFGISGITSMLSNAMSALEQKACQVATAPVTEVANQRYTLPGGLGSIGLNGSANVSLPSVNIPGVGPTQLVAPTPASSGGLWNTLSKMLSF
jgi:hypothetical protein